jgi:hypothetical protein
VVFQWCHSAGRKCYSDATVVLQCCSSSIAVVLQWCYSGVTVLLQCCYSCITAVLQRFYSDFVVALQCCYSGATVYSPAFFGFEVRTTCVTVMLQWCWSWCSSIPVVLQWSHSAIAVVLQCCYSYITVVS